MDQRSTDFATVANSAAYATVIPAETIFRAHRSVGDRVDSQGRCARSFAQRYGQCSSRSARPARRRVGLMALINWRVERIITGGTACDGYSNFVIGTPAKET